MKRRNQGPAKSPWGQFLYTLLGFLLLIGIGHSMGNEAQAKENQTIFKPIKACELLTSTEVEAVLGGKVGEPRQTLKENQRQKFWMSTCDYYSPAKNQRAGILIKSSQTSDPLKAFEVHTASLKKALGDKYTFQIIEGIGARASWDGSAKQLTVFEGPLTFIVTMGLPGDEKAALEKAKMIAAKVLAKLPRLP